MRRATRAREVTPARGGTFIRGRRSRGSRNRRGGENGSRSVALADRNSDPDHSFDLALRRPARLKHTLNQISESNLSEPAVLGRPALRCGLDPQTSDRGFAQINRVGGAIKSESADREIIRRESAEQDGRASRCQLRQSTRRKSIGRGERVRAERREKTEIDGQRLGTALPLPLWRLGSGPYRCPSIQCSEKSPPEHSNWQHPI